MGDFIGGIRFARSIFLIFLGTVSVMSCKAQVAPASTPQNQAQSEESGASTDLFVMLGSDLDRPGWSSGSELQHWNRPYVRLP